MYEQNLMPWTWFPGIWNYIEGIRFTVSDLAARVIKTQVCTQIKSFSLDLRMQKRLP
jgi:hypothetical protein